MTNDECVYVKRLREERRERFKLARLREFFFNWMIANVFSLAYMRTRLCFEISRELIKLNYLIMTHTGLVGNFFFSLLARGKEGWA